MDYLMLQKYPLFKGLDENELTNAIRCMNGRVKEFDKNSVIFHSGEITNSMGLVLSGSVNIEFNDVWGNKTIIGHISEGQIFAETYACIPNENMLVDAVANEKTKVLLLNANILFTACHGGCSVHPKIIVNLLKIFSQKNLSLSKRILHTAPKTIRERLLSYFSEQSVKNSSYSFTVPFNRQQLADYLEVDRSAMSSELSKMQKDGIIKYNKNQFTLLKKDI